MKMESIYITWLIIHWSMYGNVLYRACFIYLLALKLVKERKLVVGLNLTRLSQTRPERYIGEAPRTGLAGNSRVWQKMPPGKRKKEKRKKEKKINIKEKDIFIPASPSQHPSRPLTKTKRITKKNKER